MVALRMKFPCEYSRTAQTSKEIGSRLGIEAVTTDSVSETYVVVDDAEQNGFARLVGERSGSHANTELFVNDAGEAIRLRTGDHVVGCHLGNRLTDVRITAPARPPIELRASVAALVNKLEDAGLEIPVSADDVANREWRCNPRQQRGSHPFLRAIVLPQLRLLFRWSEAHPLDDVTVAERLSEAMRRLVPGFAVTQTNHEGELVSFFAFPSGPEIPLGDGDWEQPKGCFAPLVRFANETLSAAGARARWIELREDYLLADPATGLLLIEHGLVDAPE